jgi:hypothetical protein
VLCLLLYVAKKERNIKLRCLWGQKEKNIKLCLDGPTIKKLMLHYLSHNYFASRDACLFISVHLGKILSHH